MPSIFPLCPPAKSSGIASLSVRLILTVRMGCARRISHGRAPIPHTPLLKVSVIASRLPPCIVGVSSTIRHHRSLRQMLMSGIEVSCDRYPGSKEEKALFDRRTERSLFPVVLSSFHRNLRSASIAARISPAHSFTTPDMLSSTSSAMCSSFIATFLYSAKILVSASSFNSSSAPSFM